MSNQAKAVNLDFSGVKERGAFNPKRVSAGDYAATITKVEMNQTQTDQTDQYVFTIKLDKFSQNTYPYRCKLQENQLWKLRNIAVAAGMNVPKKRMKFDPNKLVGKHIGVTLEDDDYEKDGKTVEKSEVNAVFPMSELAEGEMADDSDEFDEDSGPVASSDEADDDSEDEAESKPKKSKKDKGDKAGGKKKKGKKKGSDDDVEELDISDIG
jgi:hypothetical protein